MNVYRPIRTAGLLAVWLALAGLPLAGAGCRPAARDQSRARVLCSVHPVYLLTQAVAQGSDLHVQLMLPSNMGCPHDYSLSPEDMRKLAAADVLVVNGLGLEEFLGEPVRKANPNVKTIRAGEAIEGLLDMDHGRDGDEHDHDGHAAPAATPAGAPAHGEAAHAHAHRHEGLNPHVFASPRMAARMARRIAEELGKVYPAHARLFADNAARAAADLDALADEFAQAGRSFARRKIVTEHGVFDYLARDCGLEIVAVVEEAPGQEPSAARMIELIKLIKDSGAAAVFTEPQYPVKVGQTIAREAGVPVASLDPVASGPAEGGIQGYHEIMRKNLDTLKKTLGTGTSEQ
ncbi:MAG: High-affinity zinc uptake system binding-protein ZnuA precursor [Planctomycetes bacterium ADurb.Bin126]|nr:MAG: High-affinity zinc uptake system binding-protein ZnuA precursor [Planctomycetes bacterium ADurb.Bin126]HOD82852.1 zinc ABC transporter substrate-binding protein [Phycisphaerae bacterium]HQL75542.1 zinc ABC transporter substrate-binding protein [Phycisphaerae bacterium]